MCGTTRHGTHTRLLSPPTYTTCVTLHVRYFAPTRLRAVITPEEGTLVSDHDQARERAPPCCCARCVGCGCCKPDGKTSHTCCKTFAILITLAVVAVAASALVGGAARVCSLQVLSATLSGCEVTPLNKSPSYLFFYGATGRGWEGTRSVSSLEGGAGVGGTPSLHGSSPWILVVM
jgi:hypothetical protein